MTGDPPRDDPDSPPSTEGESAHPSTSVGPAIRARPVSGAPRASVPPPAARPWSRPPPPGDDTATTEWASAGHADDSVRTTEHRAASSTEPVTEKLTSDELAAVRPPKPRRIERRDRGDAGTSDKWISSDELPTTRVDSPNDIAEEARAERESARGGAVGARNRREATQIRSLFWVLVFAIVVAIAALAGLHVFARH